MSKRTHRPSPALIVSLVALFLALGGTVYAASGRIDGKTIRVKSLPGSRLVPGSLAGSKLKANTVTGKQVKESTLARVPKAEEATTAGSAVTALDAVSAEKIAGRTITCPNGTQLFLGACWETTPRAAASAAVANETCGFAGGRLPGAFELLSFSRKVSLGNNEWTDEVNTVTGPNAYSVVTVSKAGEIGEANASASEEYRCVVPLVR